MYTPTISEGCHPAQLLAVEKRGEADELGVQRHFLHLVWSLSTYRHGPCCLDEVFLLPADEERLDLRLAQMGISTIIEGPGWQGDAEVVSTYRADDFYMSEPTLHIAGVVSPPEELRNA